MILSLCDSSNSLRIFYLINAIIKVAFILVPVFLIISLTYSLFKMLTSSDKEQDKIIISKYFKKIILSVCIIFIPVIVNIVVSLVDNETVVMLDKCVEKSSIENIKYINDIENVEIELEKLSVRPTKENLESAEKIVQVLIEEYGKNPTVADKEIFENFQYALGEARAIVEENEKIQGCAIQGGTYKDGVCTIPDLSPKPDESSGETAKCGDTSKMTNYTFKGKSYLVINSKSSVTSYKNIIEKHDIRQKTKNKTYNGMCLSIAYTHAYSLYSGNTSIRLKQALKYPNASKFKAYSNDDKAKVLAKICSELVNNKPVILHVNGNTSGTSRHYVTVIGFKKSVSNSSVLSEGDLLIIDSYDGKVEGLKPVGSRFMTTGKKCRKTNYSGHQIYYIK